MKWKRSSSVCIYLISILVASVEVSGSVPAANHVSSTNSGATAAQILVVDIYSDQGGEGPNKTMGTYTIGDTVKFYIYISRNSTIRETIITPDGSVWLRMAGSLNSGIIIEYFDTQYPTGRWAISVEAQVEDGIVSDIAFFEVVDKQPYICTKTSSFNTSGSSGETRFTGKVVKTYHYSVGGVHGWDVQVDNVYFGPDIRNQTVHVQILAITRTLGNPPGYLEENITLGDEVAVYGLLNGQSISVNGSVNYYVVKLSTLCQQTYPKTPQTGSERIGLQLGEFLIVIILLVIALIAIRKKVLRVRSQTVNSGLTHTGKPHGLNSEL